MNYDTSTNFGVEYQAKREVTLNLFEKYIEERGEIWDGNDLVDWEKKVQDVRNLIYTISVAGEISAGKSTFINALLGVELLPTGDGQMTSAIVEIEKASEPALLISLFSSLFMIYQFR